MSISPIAIILARGGSKSVPKKNIRPFSDTNCLALTIRSLLTILDSTRIIVSSDSDEILNCARDYKTLTIKRPKELADDKASSEIAWLHAIQNTKLDYDLVIAPQVTSPLRYKRTFTDAINQFNENKLDSMFSAAIVSEHTLEWSLSKLKQIKPFNYDPFVQRHRRQDIQSEPRLRENGSFYIFKKDGFLKAQNRFFGKVGYLLMDKVESIEIDEPLDWLIAESVYMSNSHLFKY